MSHSAKLGAAAATAAGLVAVALLLLAGGDRETTAPPLVRDAGGELPRDFVGIVSEDAFAGDPEYRSRTLEIQSQLGVTLVRQTFDWARIETAPGRYDFGHYDGYVADLARNRIELMPLLFGAPAFRSSAPSTDPRPGVYPPNRESDFARFAAAVARRYGSRGSFWRERPELSRLPVRSWQIWNEPSLPAFWASGPSPREYARLLTASARAIRRVDRRAEIVTAGLPESRLGIPFDEYADGLYEAGGAEAFDVLAVHPYARDASAVLAALEDARGLMDRRGDRRKPIWVTELGWASDGPASSFTAGEEGQAARIRESIAQLGRRRRELRLRGFVYFNWKDAAPHPGGADFWGLHTGLLEIDGEPKPALAAFRDAVARLPGR